MKKKYINPKRAYLVVPPTGLYIREDRCQTPIDKLKTVAPRPPIDLMYIAAILRKYNVKCKISDCPVEKVSYYQLEKEVETFNPDWMIFSITTPGLKDDLKIIKNLYLKFPHITYILKGPLFNVYNYDKKFISEYEFIDVIVRGEYEDVFDNWLKSNDISRVKGLTYKKNNQIFKNEGYGYIENLDDIPFPTRDLIKNELYIRPDTGEKQTTIVTSRGCPFKCTFCLSRIVSGKKIRYRTVQNVIEELQECVDKYNIKNFLFRSDTFTVNHNWIKDLCSSIRKTLPSIKWACNSRVDLFTEEIARELKSAGCWLVAFGVESGEQEILDKLKKGITLSQIEEAIRICKKVGIKSSVYIILGLPWETKESFEKTKKFINKLNPDFVEFFYVYPFPGSELYEELLEMKLIEKDYFPKSAYGEPAFDIPNFTHEELVNMRKEIWQSFYLRPSYIIKRLFKEVKNPSVIFNYVKFGIAQLKDFLIKNDKR